MKRARSGLAQTRKRHISRQLGCVVHLRDWRGTCNVKRRGCIPSDVLWKKASEGEGAYLPTEAERPHLPLRGKLGWMTPRAGWKQPESGCTRSLLRVEQPSHRSPHAAGRDVTTPSETVNYFAT